jgi:L-serine dehydratase
MMEVIDLDGFAVSMFGDCYETLLWIDGNGEEIIKELQSRIDADEIRLHRDGLRQLIEIKGPPLFPTTTARGHPGDPQDQSARTGPAGAFAPRNDRSIRFLRGNVDLRCGPQHPLWKLAAEYEMARGGLSEAEVIEKMTEIIRILRRSIAEGIAGPSIRIASWGTNPAALKN